MSSQNGFGKIMVKYITGVLALATVLYFDKMTRVIIVDAGFMDVVLEGDNLSVMRSISLGSANRSRLGHIYEDIQCLATDLRSFSVNFVKRSANTVAHSLARFARNVVDELVWLEESPPPALEALYFDSLCFNQ